MNRRSFLTSALAVAGSVPAMAATETPVMAIFREWKRLHADWEALPLTAPLEVENAAYALVSDSEGRMMATPSETPQDMAAKMLVGHCFGDLSLLDFDCDVWAEARALVA